LKKRVVSIQRKTDIVIIINTVQCQFSTSRVSNSDGQSCSSWNMTRNPRHTSKRLMAIEATIALLEVNIRMMQKIRMNTTLNWTTINKKSRKSS